jgi:hypothetical protein
MKTTMNIPKDLLKEAMDLSGAASQTMAVILGLQELIKKKRLEKLASLQGTGVIRLTKSEMNTLRTR